jgi:hypothetical protein
MSQPSSQGELETTEKPAYATLLSFSEDRKEPSAGLMGCAAPQSRGATDQLGDMARAENWRNLGGKKGSHPFLGVSPSAFAKSAGIDGRSSGCRRGVRRCLRQSLHLHRRGHHSALSVHLRNRAQNVSLDAKSHVLSELRA